MVCTNGLLVSRGAYPAYCVPHRGNESEGDFVTPAAERGTHGYLNSDPKMQAIFIAWGADIPKGVRLNSISNLDVAPTIARLLGLEMKHAKGRAIGEIVKPGARK